VPFELFRGSLAFTRACIAAGAKVDARDGGRKTPMMTAAHFGHANVVRLLLKAGANPRTRDRFGRTACEIAADSDEPEIVELLNRVSVPKRK
jgi:ankyrin repeat protein